MSSRSSAHSVMPNAAAMSAISCPP
jgi:hypothetical protein